MEVTVNEVREVVESLPIGLYALRRVPCELKIGIETSYYNPAEDKIYISYDIIKKSAKNIPSDDEDFTKEVAIRSMVYHELSHAILTPSDKHHYLYSEKMDIINIFEDERIETILADFYLDVNFKKQLLMINGGSIPDAENPLIAFYLLVRYRLCNDKHFLNEVDRIITTYKDVNGNDDFYSGKAYSYLKEIRNLFSKFKTAYENDKNISNVSQEEKDKKQNEFNSGNSQGTKKDVNGQGNRDKYKEENGSGNSTESESGQENEIEESESGQENKKDGKKIKTKNKFAGIGKSAFDEVVTRYENNTLTSILDNIISQFNKKNKDGSGITSYSGVFNPRLVGNDNYKYFERAITTNGNNKFGKFHLNLYIDNSGSFENNADKVNTLIRSLEKIEKKNKNFDFDVIRCGSGMTETTKETRWINANEGTVAYYEETKEIFKRHNFKKDSYVKNILMYDGDCTQYDGNSFKIFDTPNTTIIDSDNGSYLTDIKSAKVISLQDTNYAEHFIDEVIKSLSNAFR